MPEEMLESILSQLAGKILPAPYGPDTTSLNHGLHFTGGRPFVSFPLLCRAVGGTPSDSRFAPCLPAPALASFAQDRPRERSDIEPV